LNPAAGPHWLQGALRQHRRNDAEATNDRQQDYRGAHLAQLSPLRFASLKHGLTKPAAKGSGGLPAGAGVHRKTLVLIIWHRSPSSRLADDQAAAIDE